jgi:AraC-like DNA-binding protein
MKQTLLFSLLFSLSCPHLAAQENPFIVMAAKPYAEYSAELEKDAYLDIDLHDSPRATQTAAQMREAAHVSGNKKWLLEASLYEANHRYFRPIHLQKPNQQEMERLAEEMIATLLPIVEKAKKTGAKDIQFRALHSIMQRYMQTKNYEMGFHYCLELDKSLSAVSAEEFPLRPLYYVQITHHYISFREYETARLFLEKVLENPDMAYRQRVLESTWNDLGLIHRYHYQNFPASDSCFSRILELKPTDPERISPTADAEIRLSLQEEYELWAAIAKGNLGHNAFLQGQYEKAIPLLKHGMAKSVENNPYNYPYAAGKALVLANIFLEKKDPLRAKSYADTASGFLDRSRQKDKVAGAVRDIELWAQYFQVMNRYWRMRGDYAQALLYADSTLTARTLFEDDFNLRKLHRAEQRAKHEELQAEKLRSERYRRSTVFIAAFLSLLLILLGMLYHYYRKKKAAYHDLIQKNKHWADSNQLEKRPAKEIDGTNNANDRQLPTEKEIDLTSRIHEMMTTLQLYRNSALTLDSLAHLLGVNRETVSRSINRATGKNFSRFLNEYRIKEAVRFLSSMRNRTVNFDEIAAQLGFNNRETFHRAFKQITGLPPNEFKKNV